MKFLFPFPTLQHLASLRIAVHMANAKIGPYRSFPEAVWDRRSAVRLRDSELELILIRLRVPEHLKPTLMVVVTGVFHQLCQWLSRLGRCMDHIGKWKEHFVANFRHMEFVFDVHGRLDVTAVWGRFFVPKMAATSEIEPLLELMEVAVFHQQLTHLDTIFRKVVDIFDSGTILEGPSYTSSEGEILRMRYGFKERRSQSTFRVLRSKFHQHTDSVFLDEDGITITIFGTWMSVQAFQQHWWSLNEPWRMPCADVLGFANNHSANSTREFLESLNETEFNETLKTLGPAQRVLENFLLWPLAQYVFLPLLQCFRNHPKTRFDLFFISDDFVLFLAIVKKMPLEVEFGEYYNNIFLEFWNGIPSNKKRSLYNSLGTRLNRLQRKNPSLHQMVLREIEVLPEEDNEVLLIIG